MSCYYTTQLEGFDGPLPPFTWIRIDPAHLRYFAEDFEGLVAPAFYQEAQQEHPLGGDGQPTHADNEYVLTREDVGFYMGVRYDVVRESDVCLSRSSTPGPPPPPSAIELITGDAEAETEAEVGAEEQQQTGEDAPEYKFIVLSTHGVVKPGPPRLTTFDIGGTMKVRNVFSIRDVHY